MTFKQFFPIPLFIAALATILMVLEANTTSTLPHLRSWIVFQAWAMYFMAGCTRKGGGKVMLGYFGGAVASIAIMELAGLLGGTLGSSALYAAVFIVVIPVICAERVPGFDFVPAWFVGAGVFFGFFGMNDWAEELGNWDKYGTTASTVMFSCLIGMFFGVVTIFLRTKYEASLKLDPPAAATEE